MAEESCIADIIRNTRQEILFAIKERILEMAKINDDPFPLKGITIGDERYNRRVSLDYYEINNVYVDDSGTLCGDLVCRHGALAGDVFFGKSVEYLGIEDLKTILDALYKHTIDASIRPTAPAPAGRRQGFSGIFARKPASNSRAMRNNP
jgi:hypothetical protein